MLNACDIEVVRCKAQKVSSTGNCYENSDTLMIVLGKESIVIPTELAGNLVEKMQAALELKPR